jgi:L-ascorbate metabolism protein UlaG (beta-lactamase superfamily)
MLLTWLGHSCFRLQDKTGPDGVTLITDPFDKSVGIKPPQFEADIVTVSHNHEDHNNAKALRGQPYVVDSPGEYDIRGVAIQGIACYHDQSQGNERGSNIIYRIEIDDISVVHLGDLGHILENKQLEAIGRVDVLLVPVGGTYTLDAKKAAEVVSQIEPRIVVPMHYALPGVNLKIAGVEPFVKEIGIKPLKEDKLKLSRKDLPQEEMELVLFNL